MNAEHRGILADEARRLSVALTDQMLDQFGKFQDLLLKWNRHIKLTTIVEPSQVVDRHFVDSLSVVRVLRTASTMVDVGSGAGFPGLPVAIALPKLRITLVESIQKKAAFLEAVRRELGLRNVEVKAERFEQLVQQGRSFDLAVSRATLAPADWLKAGGRLVAAGGALVAMVVPGPHSTADLLFPDWRSDFERAEDGVAYAPGRGLVVLEGKRA